MYTRCCRQTFVNTKKPKAYGCRSIPNWAGDAGNPIKISLAVTAVVAQPVVHQNPWQPQDETSSQGNQQWWLIMRMLELRIPVNPTNTFEIASVCVCMDVGWWGPNSNIWRLEIVVEGLTNKLTSTCFHQTDDFVLYSFLFSNSNSNKKRQHQIISISKYRDMYAFLQVGSSELDDDIAYTLSTYGWSDRRTKYSQHTPGIWCPYSLMADDGSLLMKIITNDRK